MEKGIIHKIYEYCIFTFILTLPFYCLPERYPLPFIGGNLAMIPLGVSAIFLLYEWYKFGIHLEKRYKIFLYVYFGWQLLCLVIGLCSYEFNHLLTLDQIPRLEKLVFWLKGYGIYVEELLNIKIWLFLRFSKNILLANSSIFFVAFLVLHTFKDNFNRGIRSICSAVFFLFLLLSGYSFIELSWLYFETDWAANMLAFINQRLYDVASSHGWWPPLLWKGQLRSILGEPSHFGVLAIFALPLLWLRLIENKNVIFFILYVTVMIFATNSRTAVIAFVIEVIVLVLFNLLIRKGKLTRLTGVIIVCSIFSFFINLVLSTEVSKTQHVNGTDRTVVMSIDNYVSNNIGTVAKVDARSNNARLLHLIGSIDTVIENPIFGVGEGLHSAYIDRNLPDGAFKNLEVRNWSKYMQEKGVLKSGYPGLNSYTYIAVRSGFVGLLIYLLPFVYVITYFLINRREKMQKDLQVPFLMVSLIGLLAARMATSQFSVCEGIILGLLCIKINTLEKEGNDYVTDKT